MDEATKQKLEGQGLQIKAEDGPFIHCYNPIRDQNSLHSNKAFKAGDTISSFTAVATHPSPSMYTLQVNETEHIELSSLMPYTNHSCEPTVFFNTSDRLMVALTDMQPGDQLTFFYPSTEWVMDEPFQCMCGMPTCLGRIVGAYSMPQEVLDAYQMNDHIKRLQAVGG